MASENSAQNLIKFFQEFQKKTAQNPNANTGELSELRTLARQFETRLNRPTRIFIGGEYGSGKSTLANILAGEQLIPASILSGGLPPLIFRYGAAIGAGAGWWGKKVNALADYIDFVELTAENPDFIVIQLPNPILKQFNFFDAPGAQQPAKPDRRVEEMIKRADMLVWCTNVLQAWAEPEKKQWSKLPEKIRDHGILVVTHVDLPAAQHGFERVMSRLMKQAGPGFQAIASFAAPTAIDAAPGGKTTDKRMWKDSGAASVLANILSEVDLIQETLISDIGATAKSKFVPFVMARNTDKKQKVETPPPPAKAPTPAPSKPQEAKDLHPILQSWNLKVDALITIAETPESIDDGDYIQTSCDVVMEIIDTISEADVLDDKTDWILPQFHDALDLLILLQVEDGDTPVIDATNILVQLGRDLPKIASLTK